MATDNPFRDGIHGLMPPAADDAHAITLFGLRYAADALWDLVDDLPNKAEATLAKRKLEEFVYWAERGAGKA